MLWYLLLFYGIYGEHPWDLLAQQSCTLFLTSIFYYYLENNPIWSPCILDCAETSLKLQEYIYDPGQACQSQISPGYSDFSLRWSHDPIWPMRTCPGPFLGSLGLGRGRGRSMLWSCWASRFINPELQEAIVPCPWRTWPKNEAITRKAELENREWQSLTFNTQIQISPLQKCELLSFLLELWIDFLPPATEWFLIKCLIVVTVDLDLFYWKLRIGLVIPPILLFF